MYSEWLIAIISKRGEFGRGNTGRRIIFKNSKKIHRFLNFTTFFHHRNRDRYLQILSDIYGIPRHTCISARLAWTFPICQKPARPARHSPPFANWSPRSPFSNLFSNPYRGSITKNTAQSSPRDNMNASCSPAITVPPFRIRHVFEGVAALTAETWLRTRPYSIVLRSHRAPSPRREPPPPPFPSPLHPSPRPSAPYREPRAPLAPHPPLPLRSPLPPPTAPYRITQAFWNKRSKDQPMHSSRMLRYLVRKNWTAWEMNVFEMQCFADSVFSICFSSFSL